MRETITVYWSPDIWDDFITLQDRDRPIDWNILYEEPQTILKSLNFSRNKKTTKPNDIHVFRCPAFIDKLKNIYVLQNPLETKVQIDNNQSILLSPNGISTIVERGDGFFNNNKMLTYQLSWLFFTEEETLPISLTGPYFSQSQYLNKASLIPGTFDIGQWFRGINLEFNLWDNVSILHFREEEHLAYIEFHTDKQIELKRFRLNNEIKKIAVTAGSSSFWETNVPLIKRYERFRKSKLKQALLKEIKQNLI